MPAPRYKHKRNLKGRKYPPLGLGSYLPFGQYKGELLWEIITMNPRYVNWLIENMNVELDNDAYDELQKALDKSASSTHRVRRAGRFIT